MVRNRLFIASVAALIGLVIAGYVYSYVTDNTFSRIEFGLGKVEPRGTLASIDQAVTDKRLNRVVNGFYQAKVQNYLRREFLFFDRTLLGYSTAVTTANKAFYSALLPNQPVVPLGVDSGNMFLDKEAGALVGITLGNTKLFADERRNAEDARLLAERHPEIDFNYYGVTAWTMTREARAAALDDPSAIAWDRFVADIDRLGSERTLSGPTVKAKSLDVADWDEYFFRTDHHWNPTGAYQGYLDIMDMLAQHDSKIGAERLPYEERVVEGIEYRGASSRKAAYEPISEDFRILMTHDPDLQAWRRGKRADGLIIRQSYLDDPPTAPFADQYASFHGHGMGIHEYRNTRKRGTGTLLMFGDSFSRGLDDLVASHFDRTFVIDLRSYEAQEQKRFDFESFVAEHDVTTVVIIGRPVRVMSHATALVEGTGVQ